jgi:hypothetical protein
MLAAEKGHAEVVQLLVAAEADKNLQDKVTKLAVLLQPEVPWTKRA